MQFHKKSIAIFGCGFVGQAVAQTLKSHHLTLSTTSLNRVEQLSKFSQDIAILKGCDREKIAEWIENQDVLILTMAPKTTDSYQTTYVDTAKNFAEILQNTSSVRQIIYTSSTGVYAENEGGWVTETSPLIHTPHARGKYLSETEEILLSLHSSHRRVCIFRLGEIYGDERSLKKKIERYSKNPLPLNPKSPTNMIHIDDICSAIEFSLNHDLNGIYNLVDDDHIERSQLYAKLTKLYQLPAPLFSHETTPHSHLKRVSNQKLKEAGYQLIHPHRVY
ncbi:MAG: SDR family oxidoreductase [Simkaniaceae bacterium]|nr:SDR family oxidoreductase [Simkaniaceae bacterium]